MVVEPVAYLAPDERADEGEADRRCRSEDVLKEEFVHYRLITQVIRMLTRMAASAYSSKYAEPTAASNSDTMMDIVLFIFFRAPESAVSV